MVDNSSTITHQSLPQHGRVRAGGLIAAHQPVSGKRILNAGHGRVTFPRRHASLTWLQNQTRCCFSIKTSQNVEKMRLFIQHVHLQIEREAVRGLSFEKRRKTQWGRWTLWLDPLWQVTWSAALTILHMQLGAIVQCHYSRVSFPIHSKLSLSYRFHFWILQARLPACTAILWLFNTIKSDWSSVHLRLCSLLQQFESAALHLFFQPSTLAVLNEHPAKALFLW